MSENYDHQKVESKWQKFWVDQKTFKADDHSKKPKHYILDMYPYPSGAGLHVGHPLGYTATDIISRKKRMEGYEVLHPMGWDAFGLPAENYAIKTQVHPDKSTRGNIETFRKQIQSIGMSYDWDREVGSCFPDYYKWTQWFFRFLYKNDLAYKKKAPVNWCESCHTVLANEQVVDGACDRCDTPVALKMLNQWFFRVKDFIEDQPGVDGLLSGLDKIDWPNSTKIGQRNWIGRSEGVDIINLKVKDMDLSFEVYDSVPQTFMAQTFTVIAPEHPWVEEMVKGTEREKEVMDCVERIKKNKASGKFDIETDMEGVFTGRYVENYCGMGRDLPIWVASFVVMDYGTGIVNCSVHDDRDFAFAKKYDIPLHVVMLPPDAEEAEQVKNLEHCYHHAPEGIMQEPVQFKGRQWGEVRQDIIDYMIENDWATPAVNYKLRDWLISRQRYWGSPIPVVYDDQEQEYIIPEDELPVHLPTDVDFVPHGESPLAKSKKYHDKSDLKRIEDKLKASGDLAQDRTIVRRESDTMDTFVCSSWYMWRFMDPHNEKEFCSKALANHWGPIDLYVGGAEHTVLHLLYARFFCKVLKKYGYINYDEPFTKLRHQGMILGENQQKMSKSKGNVINPDLIVEEYGADTLRCYEMFMGPFHQMKPWSQSSVGGIRKWLDRVWRVLQKPESEEPLPKNVLSTLHQTIKMVGEHIDEFKFNTAVSQLMILTNELTPLESLPKAVKETYILIFAPFAPHLAEEAWQQLGHKDTITFEAWPKYDAQYLVQDTVTYAVQVNGKVRGELHTSKDTPKEEAISEAKKVEKVAQYLSEGTIKKEIFVPGKIIGFVVS
ncbi:MAG TPA: leucine--tRNA ligase [Candidatus Gracilibacteria bacterium]